MENQDNSHHHPKNKINNRSMSDTDSQASQLDEFHSPLRSPLRYDEPFPLSYQSPAKSSSKAIVTVDKYYSSSRSPLSNHQKPPQTLNVQPPAKAQSPLLVFSRSVTEEVAPGVTRVGPSGVSEGYGGGGGEDGGGVGGEKRSRAAVASILRRPRRDVTVERAALGFRVCEVILSLISFSVMASDKTQGWSGDSFDRYKEYRYCVSVNVIAFVYSGFQAADLAYHLIGGKHAFSHHFRCHFEFSMDQILAYLLISASSSAATRVDDWVSNWGKDAFTEKATASIGISFLAFLAFALSSLISGYNLCSHNSV